MNMLHANRRLILSLLLTLFIAACLGLVAPFTISYMVEYGILQGQMNIIWPISLVLMSVVFVTGGVGVVLSVLFQRFEHHIVSKFQVIMIRRFFQLPLSFFHDDVAGHTVNRMALLTSMMNLVGAHYFHVIFLVLFLFVNVALMFYVAWHFALWICLVSFFFCTMMVTLTMHQLPRMHHGIMHREALCVLMLQVLRDRSTMRAYTQQQSIQREWERRYHAYQAELSKSYALGLWRLVCFNMLPLLGLVCMYLGFLRYVIPNFLLCDMVILSVACMQYFMGFSMLSTPYADMIATMFLYQRLKPMLQIHEFSSTKDTPSAARGAMQGKITVSCVQFSYPSSTTYVLNHLNFIISPGEHVGLLGPSGAGKSTILKLLAGLHFPQRGFVQCDEFSTWHEPLFRQHMGVVFQEYDLTSGSILDNLIGNTPLSEEDAWYAANLVGLDDFIASLPMRMHTVISQMVCPLSSGQLQLIRIARALASKPRILLLDDVHEVLDNHLYSQFMKRLECLNITILSVATRLSALRFADRILILDSGKIIEEGCYEDLKSNALFVE